MQRLPAPVIIHARPGGNRPAVIHLPVQRAHAVRLVPPVAFNGGPHGLRLKNLAHIQEALEILWPGQIDIHVFFNQQIAASVLLMSQHHFGFQLHIAFFSIGEHRFQLGERLEAVFTHEAANLDIVVLKRLTPMPYAPIVHIPFTGHPCSVLFHVMSQIPHWRRCPVSHIRVAGGHGLRQDPVENRLIILPQLLTDLLAELFLPTPAHVILIVRPGRVHLIITAPQSDARMVAQSPDVIDCLLTHILQERLISRVHAAGEHEILPDQQTILIA
ncbi:hypothetical protein D3C74_340150 [compost metagenome]